MGSPRPGPRRRDVIAAAAAVAAAAATTSLATAPGPLKTAILVDDQATLIDFAGAWQALCDAQSDVGFEVYTVAPDLTPRRCYHDLILVPNHTFETAPAPDIILMGAQTGTRGATAAKLDWIRTRAATARLTASVCTGAFILAQTGLLDGLSATTHHDFFDAFAARFPAIPVVRDRRIVDHGHIVTAGGESCSIDLGLFIVQRFYGRDVAQATARYMEFEGRSWLA